MSEHSGYPGAPPGWYPDPAGGPGRRWWDGYAWSEATVLPETLPPPPSPAAWAGAAPPHGAPLSPAPWAVASERLSTYNAAGLVQSELWILPAARLTLAVPGIVGVLQLLLVRSQVDQLRAFGHDFRIAYRAAQNGQPTPTFHDVSFSPWFFLLFLVGAGALLVSLIWQHRAATAARALDLPSTLSPAWGVGSWFVPIVSLWFPYQAVRDCLAPDDPHRARVLRWWLALVVAGGLTGAAFFAAFFSSGASIALSVPAAVLDVAVVALAPGVVTAIGAAHRDALARTAGAGRAL